MINFLHNYIPESVLFQIGPIKIHWYGFLMVLGGVLGLLLILKLINLYSKLKIEDLKLIRNFQKKDLLDLIFWWVIGAIIFARIYYVIYAWDFYQDDWMEIFKIWHGGLAVHGVMLGGFLSTFLFCLKRKLKIWQVLDFVAIALVTGQIIGRWGNYFNQEIFGKPTDLAWGIPIEMIKRPVEFVNESFFHPTVLYESLGNIFILGILLLLFYLQFKKKNFQWGMVFLSYLIWYSILRFLLEFLRIDYSPLIFGIRWAQVFSVFLVLVSLFFLFLNLRKSNNI